MKKVWLFVLVTGLVFSFSFSYGAEKEKGLIGWWKFDEGKGEIAKDSSGNGNDGDVIETKWVQGKKGFALSFEGTDDCVEIPHSEILNLGNEGTNYSIEFWVKISNSLPKGGFFLIKPTDNSYPFAFTQEKTGIVGFKIYNKTPAPEAYVVSPTSLVDGIWHHIVGIRDGTNNKLVMYIDGKLAGTKNDEIKGDMNNEGPVKIGKSWGDDFGGTIDEVKIYNRALTADEIKAHFEGK